MAFNGTTSEVMMSNGTTYAEMMRNGRGPELAAVTISLLVLSWISVGLRAYTASVILKRFNSEDWLAALTLLCYSTYSALLLFGVHFGLGAHVVDVSLENRPKALFFKWAGQWAYIVNAGLVKCIAGLLLLRLCTGHRWQRIAIRSILVVSVLFNTFYVFFAIFQCRPAEFYWHRYDSLSDITGKCNNKTFATIPNYLAFIISIISDWTLALIPISMVWNANLERRIKISVSCVLALGSIASLATIVRIPFARQLLSNPDYLYNFTDFAIWSTVELGLGLTASSLATLKPLFRKCRSKRKNNSKGKGRSRGSRFNRRSVFQCPRRSRNAPHGVRSVSGAGAANVEIFDGRPTSDQAELKQHRWESLGSVTTTITASPLQEDDDAITSAPPLRGHVTRTTSISFSEAQNSPADIPYLPEMLGNRSADDMV
ncbi:hypothetical protein F5Y15DRAFT_389960 [Xylariaceae sp. FL0016]|nr:hypothetical protein F5Y15DRAFT_389960 [Xylariaceae sp. FL0016]